MRSGILSWTVTRSEKHEAELERMRLASLVLSVVEHSLIDITLYDCCMEEVKVKEEQEKGVGVSVGALGGCTDGASQPSASYSTHPAGSLRCLAPTPFLFALF